MKGRVSEDGVACQPDSQRGAVTATAPSPKPRFPLSARGSALWHVRTFQRPPLGARNAWWDGPSTSLCLWPEEGASGCETLWEQRTHRGFYPGPSGRRGLRSPHAVSLVAAVTSLPANESFLRTLMRRENQRLGGTAASSSSSAGERESEK